MNSTFKLSDSQIEELLERVCLEVKLNSTNLEAQGWKEIFPIVRCKDKRTARKRLRQLGLLCYDANGRPVLNIEAYRIASLQKHLTPHKKQKKT